MIRPAPFRAGPATTEQGTLIGPFSGKVVDTATGKPISNALVYASWSMIAEQGPRVPAGWREHVTSTDIGGAYEIPALKDLPRGGDVRLAGFHLVVYKRGYVAYRSDRRFDDGSLRLDFVQRQNVATLDPWRPELSHVRHLAFLGGGPTLHELTTWEREEASLELSRGRAEPPRLRTTRPITAAALLSADDVRGLSGFAGAFESGPLADEPSRPGYDSIHHRAVGRSEDNDVALRVWLLAPDELDAHFERLQQQLPTAARDDRLGDRSFTAVSPGQEIRGLGWLDRGRGVVLLLQCGSAQCRDDAGLLALARGVEDRLARLVPLGGQP